MPGGGGWGVGKGGKGKKGGTGRRRRLVLVIGRELVPPSRTEPARMNTRLMVELISRQSAHSGIWM